MRLSDILRLAGRLPTDRLPGGLGDERPDTDFDPGQLQKGIKVEMEHTDDPELAREIAKDHLAEDPRYYDKLETIDPHGRAAASLDARIEQLKDRMEGFDRSMEQLKDRQEAALAQESLSPERKEVIRTSFERRIEAIQRDKNEVINAFQKLMAKKCSQPKG